MSFRIRTEAREWFRDLRDKEKMDMDFDYYYLCLMAGLANKEKASQDTPQSETIELAQDFPGEYRSRQRIIIALFIKTELEQMGISLSERTMLNEQIGLLVDPRSASGLKNEGERVMNRYANRGFEIIQEWFEERPRNLEIFLPLYKRKLDLVLKGQPK